MHPLSESPSFLLVDLHTGQELLIASNQNCFVYFLFRMNFIFKKLRLQFLKTVFAKFICNIIRPALFLDLLMIALSWIPATGI